jgi:DNA-binding YbaB/EbfC family protein
LWKDTDVKNFPGQSGPGGMGDILRQAQKMQQDIKRAQDELAKRVVEGSAGGGVVKAFVNGKMHLVKVSIDKEVVDPEDVEMLEDMVAAAYADAARKAQSMIDNEMSKFTGGLNIPGLGGLF